MKLYHGTSESAASLILKHGLKPRGRRKGNWKHSIESNPKTVYLTSTYALYFAQHVIAIENFDKERGAILEVDLDFLDEWRLHPDEDFLEQGSRGQKTPGLSESAGMKKRTRYFRELALGTHLQPLWQDSLEHLGTVGYFGTIPEEAITRVAFVDFYKRRDVLSMAIDPSITLNNHRFCKGKYIALTKWIFGEEVSPLELLGIPPSVAAEVEHFKEHIEHVQKVLNNKEGIEVTTLSKEGEKEWT